VSPGFLAYLAVCLGIITIAVVAACAVCVAVMLKVRRLASEAEKVVGAVRCAVRPLAAVTAVAAAVGRWMGSGRSEQRRKG